ncbi:MAG: hypothetical protein D6820_02035 [Lentisphaerae bacterium]|nr:MAG: hypothetical protein D6820_02035 [Lentisphaerota bacterium]
MGRNRRLKFDGMAVHLYNRAISEDFCGKNRFTTSDKAFFLFWMKKLLEYFHFDLLSYCVMDNHFHIVLWVPRQPRSLEESARIHNAYYGMTSREDEKRSTAPFLDPNADPELCAVYARRMMDYSEFMHRLQFVFTRRYNNERPGRRGPLWESRFKCTVLPGPRALFDCISYVELNPVRGGLAEHPGEYGFCSWGLGSGGPGGALCSHPCLSGLARAYYWWDDEVLRHLDPHKLAEGAKHYVRSLQARLDAVCEAEGKQWKERLAAEIVDPIRKREGRVRYLDEYTAGFIRAQILGLKDEIAGFLNEKRAQAGGMESVREALQIRGVGGGWSQEARLASLQELQAKLREGWFRFFTRRGYSLWSFVRPYRPRKG